MRACAEAPRARWLQWVVLVLGGLISNAQVGRGGEAEIHLLAGDQGQPIVIQAAEGTRWTEGEYEVVLLPRECRIQQGQLAASAKRAVLWLLKPPPWDAELYEVIAYLEDSSVEYRDDTSPDHVEAIQRQVTDKYVGRFYSRIGINTDQIPMLDRESQQEALYRRALDARNFQTSADTQHVQFDQPQFDQPQFNQPQFNQPQFDQPQFNPAELGGSQGPFVEAGPNVPAAPPPRRRIVIQSRDGNPWQGDSLPSPDGTEQVTVVTSPVNILIEGLDGLGTVDISTDRLVMWVSRQNGGMDFNGGIQSQADLPLELYLEGNVVFRQGNREIQARSMYYNVRQEAGVVLDAEMLTPVPEYEGLLKIKADLLRQLNRNQFTANGAAATSSRLGVPRYWIQSQNIDFEDYPAPMVDPVTGFQVVDPVNNQPVVTHQRRVTSRNNFVYLAGFPVFYWPTLSTDFTRPSFFIERVRFKQDQVFGTQFGVDFNMIQLLGIRNPIPGTSWTSSFDYLSERGWGGGTDVQYDTDQFLGFNRPAKGYVDAWGINDSGLDNLGLDRRALVPEKDVRGRILWRHRQRLQRGFQVTAELGAISDRNFLEQYFEYEWDQLKDQTTGIEIKQFNGNGSWSVAVDGRVNDFFTQTEWLPKFDHFQLGQSLWGDRVTWYEHTQIGYGRLRPADRPLDPTDEAKFNPLAWEADVEGVRVGTRNELDVPFELGAVKVVPYVLGEAMHWGEDVTGDDVTRLFGQAGVRASLPMWRVDPWWQSTMLNVNGLAHKTSWDAEFFWADASEDLSRLALYDPLDDDSIEHFRRRYVDDDFGGVPNVDDVIPLKFDERFFALRSGMQGWVTAPSAEIADDLMVVRLASRNRWETKRGLPGHQRIVDWITFNVEGTLFPKAERDNFGAGLGMLNYNARWHVGDRLTLVSDGFADTFGEGLRMFSVGGYISRPERGSFHLGLRTIKGPISSYILSTAYHYRLSEKWLTSLGAVFDFGATGNIGQRVEITRIGESFLVGLGLNVDESRGNVGVGLTVEPRFLPLTRRGRVGGMQIPPAGARGLE